MKPHPIIDYPFRWIPMLVLALILVATQVVLVCGYTGNDYLPALVDGVATIGWLAAIAYLAWFVVGLVSLFQTDIIMIIVGSLLWLAGSFMICDIMVRIVGISYIPFAQTIPFRLLFGLPTLIAITLWYRLIVTKEEVQNQELDKELAAHQLTVTEQQGEPQTELIDRITVKDGSRIHLVKTDELIYIQACGDYVTVILTDKADLDVIDMQERIRLAFPNLLEIRRENQRKADYTRTLKSETLMNPYELCCSFLKDLDEQEKEILKDVLYTVQGVK